MEELNLNIQAEPESHIKLLKEYNKWRQGKGKKYAHPGYPFNAHDISISLDWAIKCAIGMCKCESLCSSLEALEYAKYHNRKDKELKLKYSDAIKDIKKSIIRRKRYYV